MKSAERVMEFLFGLTVSAFSVYLIWSTASIVNAPALFFEVFICLIGLGFILSALRRKQ